MAAIIVNNILKNSNTHEWLKHKAHDWLPAYFSRYDLTPEENLLIDQKKALQAALVDKDPTKLTETLVLFPHLINQPLNNGEIPITFAVKQNLQDKIEILLKNGADPLRKDRIGLNALDIALQKQDKPLFAQLISHQLATTGDGTQFLNTLNSVVVTGSAAKNELKCIENDAKKFRAEVAKIILPADEKKLFQVILKGDFVQFQQIATKAKIASLATKIEGEKLLTAAILGGPLILDAMLAMELHLPEQYSSPHPLRFAFCSRHPIEAYIPLFGQLQFNIHSVASSHASSKEKVHYFDLLVYQKKQNAQNMDPLAVTVWDVAFAAFSLLSFAANYQYIPLPTAAIPWVRTCLNATNYLQSISLLLFKLSYSREGKVGSATQQLMTHYVVSLFLPVRLYYAFMTVYSGWKTCLEHKYRSYSDLCKKMIVQIPAAAEVTHHASDVATPYFKGLYNRYFGIVETRNYNWNIPLTQNPVKKERPAEIAPKISLPMQKNPAAASDGAVSYFEGLFKRFFGKIETSNDNEMMPLSPTLTTLERCAEEGSSEIAIAQKTPRPMLENTDFMKSFGENSLDLGRKHPSNSGEYTGITGPMFNNEKWMHEWKTPRKSISASATVELGKNFHRDSEWFKNAIQGTPLEQAYRNMHLQAAASGQLKEFNNGFSLQAGFRVDFTGLSALEHFIETVIEGGAHFEKINNLEQLPALTSGA